MASPGLRVDSITSKVESNILPASNESKQTNKQTAIHTATVLDAPRLGPERRGMHDTVQYSTVCPPPTRCSLKHTEPASARYSPRALPCTLHTRMSPHGRAASKQARRPRARRRRDPAPDGRRKAGTPFPPTEFERRAEFKAAAAAPGASLTAGSGRAGRKRLLFCEGEGDGGKLRGEMEACCSWSELYTYALSLSLAASRSCSGAGKRAV